nr:YhcN/YlaJ family sporulation lipoprotein [Neobacillus drentensis]
MNLTFFYNTFKQNCFVSSNNAYVAVKLSPTSQNENTNSIEHKISQRVKSTERDIDNVYVSENPDFYDRMNTYASDIRNGRPISGFFNEFTETIRRVFPKSK